MIIFPDHRQTNVYYEHAFVVHFHSRISCHSTDIEYGALDLHSCICVAPIAMAVESFRNTLDMYMFFHATDI